MINVNAVLAVGCGGLIGSILRYAVSYLVASREHSFPLATFLVNIFGSFIIGVVIGISVKTNMQENARLFLATGICGGFTTFSAFAAENLKLIEQNMIGTAFAYITVTLLVGLLATAAGLFLSKLLV